MCMRSTSFLILLCAFLCGPSWAQVFKGHKVGETAEQFFSTTTSSLVTVTPSYCKNYLNDPRVMKAYNKLQAMTIRDDINALQQSADVDACRAVQDALAGKDSKVPVRSCARSATHPACTGDAYFSGSRLVILTFALEPGISFEDVLNDVTNEFRGSKPAMSLVTDQNGFGATLQR